MQAIVEIRHAQTQIHALSNYNKYYDGFHAFADQRDRIWYTSVACSFFDDAMYAGPFEFMIAIGFSFEYVLTNLLFVPFMSGAAYNGDMATVTFGFSAQSDEARHMTLGLECIKTTSAPMTSATSTPGAAWRCPINNFSRRGGGQAWIAACPPRPIEHQGESGWQ